MMAFIFIPGFPFFFLVIAALLGFFSEVFNQEAEIDLENFKAKAIRIEARAKLTALYARYKVGWVELGAYPCDDVSIDGELMIKDDERYQLITGTAIHDDVYQKDCPDCHCDADSFKLIAYANLDDDPQVDVLTIDDQKTIEQLIDDFQN